MSDITTHESPWLTAAQAATYLGVGTKYIYRAVRVGTLRHVVVDERGKISIRREWLDEFFEQRAKAS